MPFISKKSLWLSAGLGLLTAGAPALAVAADAPQGASTLEEIVVTARKRQENLQHTPIAVSAYTGAELEARGATDLGKVTQMTPNLLLTKMPTNGGVNSAAIYIRGIGQNDFVPTTDPGVGVYVDGVYLGRSVGAVLDLVDVERVEVLRGPQGTLFGRNTIGGAVSLTTKKPDENFGGKVVVRGGSDSRLDINGTLNVPLTDTLFTRFTAASFQQDGYVTNTFNGRKQDLGNDNTIAARFAARWIPTDALEFNLSIDYSRDRENSQPYLPVGIAPVNSGPAPSMVLFHNAFLSGPGLAAGGNPLACFLPANANDRSCYNAQWIDPTRKTVSSDAPLYSNLDVWGASLTIDWKLNDSLRLRSITAYRTFEGEWSSDPDGSPLVISSAIDIYDHEQVSQELQLLGELFDRRLEWIGGLYYYKENGKNINPVSFSQVELQSGGFYDNKSWAAFGQGTFHVTDKLDLTLGARYTEDTKKYLPDQYVVRDITGDVLEPLFGFDPTPWEAGSRVVPFKRVKKATNKWVPMANLSYQWRDNLLTYLTYSEGFKGGGFSQRVFPPELSIPSFDPEYVTSYEAGFKFDGWDRRFRLNVAGFYVDYKDLQLVVTDPSRVGPFVTNAGDAEMRGVEVETSLIPAERWLISGSFGYLDPKRTRLAGGVQGLTLDSRFEHISKYTANVQVQTTLSLGDWGELTPRFEWAFRSGHGTNANNVPFDGVAPALNFGLPNPALYQDDLHLLNASVRWNIKQSGASILAGVDNLTDKKFEIVGTFSDAFGYNSKVFDRGRQWYLQLTYEF